MQNWACILTKPVCENRLEFAKQRLLETTSKQLWIIRYVKLLNHQHIAHRQKYWIFGTYVYGCDHIVFKKQNTLFEFRAFLVIQY